MIHLIFSMILAGNFALHDFKMSVCEMAYSDEAHAFELKFYLFQDDLKQTFYHDPGVTNLEADSVKNYIAQKVQFRINGNLQPLNFHSIQEKKDQVLVSYSTIPIERSSISHISLTDELLIETFRNQTNMVFLQMPGKEKLTRMLDRNKTVGEFEVH